MALAPITDSVSLLEPENEVDNSCTRPRRSWTSCCGCVYSFDKTYSVRESMTHVEPHGVVPNAVVWEYNTLVSKIVQLTINDSMEVISRTTSVSPRVAFYCALAFSYSSISFLAESM